MASSLATGVVGQMRKTFILYTLANIAGLGLSTFSSFWAARVLGPKSMGLYNALNLLVVYSPLLTLGIHNGLNREIPFFFGKGDLERVGTLADAAHYVTRAVSLLSFLVLSVAGIFLLGYQHKYLVGIGLLVFAIIVPLTFYRNFVEVTYRTGGDFQKLAAVRLLAGLTGVACIPLLFLAPWGGMMARTLLVALASFAPLWWGRKIASAPRWSTKEFRSLFAIGLPIFAVGYLYTIMTNLDRMLVAKTLGMEALGYYTPAFLLLQGMSVLPTSVNQILYPKMAELFGRSNALRPLVSLAFRPIPVVALIQLPFLVAGWLYLPDLMQRFLPQYMPGLGACQLALIAGFLLSLSSPTIIFNIARRQGIYASLMAVSALILFVLAELFASMGYGLTGLVWAVMSGNAMFILLSAAASWLLIRREVPQPTDSTVALVSRS